MSKKNIQMQVLGESGYDEICPVPAGHKDSHKTGGDDAITPTDIGAIPATQKGVASGVATLGTDGKVPTAQLPNMDYAPSTHASQHASNGSDPITPASIGAIPATQKGVASGVATLGTNGKVPIAQLPNMDYAPSTHASQHASNGSDPITPASIGAATSNHTHSNYATTSTTTSLANRIAALESNTSLIYENSSVRNLKHAYFTVNPSSTNYNVGNTDLSVNVGFSISRAIYVACTPNFARDKDGNGRYAYNYPNTQTNGQVTQIARIDNGLGNNNYHFNLYVYFSGTTMYLRIQNNGGYAAELNSNFLGYSTNWSFDIVCIQDF